MSVSGRLNFETVITATGAASVACMTCLEVAIKIEMIMEWETTCKYL